MILKVQKLGLAHTYADRILLRADNRPGIGGGQICKLVTSQNRVKYVQVIGTDKGVGEQNIYMDFATRKQLDLHLGTEDDITLKIAGKWGRLIWAITSINPTTRIAAQLGIWSVLLAIISILLAMVPLFSR